MGGTGAGGEDEEDDDEDVDQSEVQRRKERLEREQWLREQAGYLKCQRNHNKNLSTSCCFVNLNAVFKKIFSSLTPNRLLTVPSSLSLHLFAQSEQKAKKGEDLEADDEKIGEEEDSQFMKLAKKLTAKTLQRNGKVGSEIPRHAFWPIIITVDCLTFLIV